MITKLLVAIPMIFLIGAFSASAQVTYKIPDGVFPMDWKKSGFKGMLFLEKDSPSGMFIGFPNDRESIADFRERIATFVVPMFGGQDKFKDKKLEFTRTSIPKHDGDAGTDGQYFLYDADGVSVQVLMYERATPAGSCLYGYFAQKNSKYPKNWANEKGEGIKLLDKFRKTIKP